MTEARGASGDILIFPAGPADAEDLARVHVTSWRETYADMLPAAYLARMNEGAHRRRFAHALLYPRPDELILAAGGRAGLVGYASGGPARGGPEGESEITTLYLLRRSQGLGLGGRLLRDAARALAAQGAKSLRISVLGLNHRARAFYEHLGGRASPARLERGPGGVMSEIAYHWADLGALTK